MASAQPPLGGCVLKQSPNITKISVTHQPPLGGCVLKQVGKGGGGAVVGQPPLGGCVLKLLISVFSVGI